MFDRLTWRRKHYERYPLGLDDEEDAYQAPIYDHDRPMGELARIADDVDAGRVTLPPHWKLDRPSPSVQVWTTPSGRRYACDPTGRLLHLPDYEASFRPRTTRHRRHSRSA